MVSLTRNHLSIAPRGALPPAGQGVVAPTYPEGRLLTAPVFEHVLNIIAVCSNPEAPAPGAEAPDGVRIEIWPIIGGRFEGLGGLRGEVVPGGGDFPVIRPDGAEWLSAVYRLRSDDGYTIQIDNKGFYEEGQPLRVHPEFKVARGPHDWLNKSVFVGNLVDVPAAWSMVSSADENERLIQVFRVR